MKPEVEASTTPPTRCNGCEPIKRSTPMARTSGKGRPAPTGRRCGARAHRTRAEGRSGCSGQGKTSKWVMFHSTTVHKIRASRYADKTSQFISWLLELAIRTERTFQPMRNWTERSSMHLPVFSLMLFRLVASRWSDRLYFIFRNSPRRFARKLVKNVWLRGHGFDKRFHASSSTPFLFVQNVYH